MPCSLSPHCGQIQYVGALETFGELIHTLSTYKGAIAETKKGIGEQRQGQEQKDREREKAARKEDRE